MQIGAITIVPLDRNTVADPYPNESWRLFRACSKLSPKERASLRKALEKVLQIDPHNLGCKVALLSSYAHSSNRAPRSRYCDIVCWFVDNFPTSFVTSMATSYIDDQDYKRVKRAWLRQVRLNEGNTVILRHTAQFCALYDEKYAEKLWKRGELIDGSPQWSFELLKLYFRRFDPRRQQGVSNDKRTKTAAYKKAVGAWKTFVARTEMRGLPASISYGEIETIQAVLRAFNKDTAVP